MTVTLLKQTLELSFFAMYNCTVILTDWISNGPSQGLMFSAESLLKF